MPGSARTLTTVVMVALSNWSCGSTAPVAAPDVAAVVVSPATSTLAPNAQLPLRAQVQDGSGAILTDADVTWTVQDPRIVSVSEAGVVTALAVGTSQVAASSFGKSGIAIVTVNSSAGSSGTGNSGADNSAAVATVRVAAPSKKLKVGATMQLTATALDSKGNALAHQSLVWSSSNSDRATVSASGVVTGKREGDVTITAQTSSTGGKSGSLELEVKK